MKKCSVVILNWNGKQWLSKFLPILIERTTLPDCEIVVADNGSTDDSVDYLQHEFPTVRLICFDKNYGFAEGYNRAIDCIESEYVVLLNSDVEVAPHWLEPLIEFADSHSNVAAVQPKILSWHRHEERKHNPALPDIFEHAGAAGGYIDALGYPFCRGRIMSYVAEDHAQYDTPAKVLWTSGACMLCRTAIYKKEGGLDAEFFAHMEEIDLCWRLNCRGYELWCEPRSVVWHVGGGALNYEHPQKTFLNFRNSLLTLYKNLPTSRLWWVMLCRFLLDYVAVLNFLLHGKTGNAWAVARARMAYHKIAPGYSHIRTTNLKKVKVAYPQGIISRSIVFDYYLKRQRE